MAIAGPNLSPPEKEKPIWINSFRTPSLNITRTHINTIPTHINIQDWATHFIVMSYLSSGGQ
jgi:hypothetical protein